MDHSHALMVTKKQYESQSSEGAESASGDLTQFHKIGKLAEDTRQMRLEFSDLVDTLISFLERKSRSPKYIIDALDKYLPDDCRKASDLDEFFDELLPHMSFFNYDIPKFIIQYLERDLAGQLATYEARFKSYCENRLSGPHPVVITNAAQNKDQLMEKMFVKLDVEWDGLPIEYIERFKCKLGYILNIGQEKLLLQSIQRGCVLLTFLVHGSLLQTIKKALSSDQRRELHGAHVIAIDVGSERIFENLELCLLRFCRKGDLDGVVGLIKRQVDVNARDQQAGWSGLMHASFHGYFKIVKILLENKALVDMEDKSGITPLMAASQNGHINVVKILHVYHANVNAKDLGGWTSLMYATVFNSPNIVQFLVENQAELDTQNDEKVSALHLACHHGYDKILRLLLEAGAKVDIRDQAEDTPLIYACCNGHSEVVVLLIENGANPSTTNRGGLTPLMCAVESRSVKTVKTLLNNGAQVSHMEPVSQWTALFFAAKCGNFEIVELLLTNGANPNIKDKDGITPSEVAQVHGHDQVCKELEKESQTELTQSKNFQNLQKQVFATTMYLHQLLGIGYQKSSSKHSTSTKS